MSDEVADAVVSRRRDQAELYGDSVDAIAARAEQHLGVSERDIARTIGVSAPMFGEVRAGRRTRIGNPAAIHRLRLLADFTGHIADGSADRGDIGLTLSQIRTTVPGRKADVTNVASGRSGAGPLSNDSLAAARRRVAEHVPETPTRRWPMLDEAVGTEVWVKHENHTPIGAFKVRGGLNYVARLKESGAAPRGIISATRGNHGQSLAYAGRAHGLDVVIVVPEGNSPDKNDAMAAFGAELIVHGHDFQEAAEYAERLAVQRQLTMVPPYHPWLVEGVATYAAELHEAVEGLDAVYVPIGMGSGACANIMVRDLLGRATEVIGVVAEQAPAYRLSFEARRPVPTTSADTFVDGVACRTPSADAVSVIVAGASRVLAVGEQEAAEAMALMYRSTHNLAEPAGSLALAGLLADQREDPARVRGRRVAVVHTGGNCDFDVLQRVMNQE